MVEYLRVVVPRHDVERLVRETSVVDVEAIDETSVLVVVAVETFDRDVRDQFREGDRGRHLWLRHTTLQLRSLLRLQRSLCLASLAGALLESEFEMRKLPEEGRWTSGLDSDLARRSMSQVRGGSTGLFRVVPTIPGATA